MFNNETSLEVNDYLDLYILARNLGDNDWQQEMITRLQRHISNRSLILHTLWREYKKVDEEIHELYSQLPKQASSKELKEKILNLKKRKFDISSKIQMEERRSAKDANS